IGRFKMYFVGYNGRADVLRKQNRLDEAIAAYRETILRFPKQLAVRNGLASVLAAVGQYDEAVSLLPKNSPATLSEWISYHIRGVISLRKGDLDAALKIFEWGSRENPWINNKASFETALAGVKLRQAQYKQATDLHHQNFDPAVKPIAQIFQLHAYSKLRDVK